MRYTLLAVLALLGCGGEDQAQDPTPDDGPDAGATCDGPQPPPDCLRLDLDLDGYAPDDGDCDDRNDQVSPDGAEICGDGVDQDCSGADLDCADADRDRDGVSERAGDCDDDDLSRTPGNLETCDDGVDQDCDGRDLPCEEVDEDGDGFSRAQGDCDDRLQRVYPGAAESCGDGVDQDCDGGDAACVRDDRDDDGWADGEDVCPDAADPFQSDRDLDGVGDACDVCPAVMDADQTDSDGDGTGDACDADVDRDEDGRSGADGDCDDTDPAVFPGAPERCNRVDDDCNGFVDDACPGDLRSPLIPIPGGRSLLGSQDADPVACASDPGTDENCDEVPQRTIELSAFRIEATEVTNAQYAACVEARRCMPPFRSEQFPASLRFGDPRYADHPVVFVSQIQATMYCAWAGGRLPTEAQWERAARGARPTEQRRYPWGDDAPDCDRANVDGCHDAPVTVGSTAGDRTGDGVLDMGGNVHEIVDGWYLPDWYRSVAPRDPAPPDRRGERDQIPVRGGAYDAPAAFATLSYRGFRLLVAREDRRPNLGFRCVR